MVFMLKKAFLILVLIIIANLSFSQNSPLAKKAYEKADSYNRVGDFKKSIKNILNAIDIESEQSQPDQTFIAIMNFNLGYIYSRLGNENSAVGYYNSALKIAMEAGDKSGQIMMLRTLGRFYLDTHDYEYSLKYLMSINFL